MTCNICLLEGFLPYPYGLALLSDKLDQGARVPSSSATLEVCRQLLIETEILLTCGQEGRAKWPAVEAACAGKVCRLVTAPSAAIGL